MYRILGGSDAAQVKALLQGIGGPIVLVGHSYAGSVISGAADGSKSVKALVYVAAFAPERGESAAELSAKFPGSTLAETLRPIPLPDGDQDLSRRDCSTSWLNAPAGPREASRAPRTRSSWPTPM
jgi:pimeloyl-ACP methyl ester carboxylesterase